MKATVRARARIGDVIEIAVASGFAYAQYTHKHKSYGSLLRVMPQQFSERPKDFAWLASAQPQFDCFFPLGAAVGRGIVQIVGSAPIAADRVSFPLFRASVRTPGGWGPWWLWDGDREWRIERLEPGMERLPLRGVINDTLLVERIQSGWRAEHEA